MKTKTIPFDLDIAKKIQAGEIEGKIKTREGNIINEFFSFSELAVGAYGIYATIDGLVHSYCCDGCERAWDRNGHWKGDLVLEVPDTEPQFKPFDKVLIRDDDNSEWCLALYAYRVKTGFHRMVGGVLWDQCIPYEGNEHLLGTTEKPKEEDDGSARTDEPVA